MLQTLTGRGHQGVGGGRLDDEPGAGMQVGPEPRDDAPALLDALGQFEAVTQPAARVHAFP
ncbi:hypothetical protein ACN28S_48875 [Cystobacter fuscus]